MEHAISIAQAREQPGLRLVLLRGVPSPWGQAAKGILAESREELERVSKILLERETIDAELA